MLIQQVKHPGSYFGDRAIVESQINGFFIGDVYKRQVIVECRVIHLVLTVEEAQIVVYADVLFQIIYLRQVGEHISVYNDLEMCIRDSYIPVQSGGWTPMKKPFI